MSMIKNQFIFLQDIFQNRKMLIQLSMNDLKARFASSIMGAFWAYVQPLMTMLVMWFVFQVALNNGDVNGYPFIVWFVPGFLAWNFFSEAINMATNSVRDYSYLVRKINFKVSLIPLVKILSCSFVHLAFFFLIIFINLIYGVGLSVYNLQAIYYFLCMMILLCGLGWLVSAIAPFAPDVAAIVNIIVGMGFWATPICWNPDTIAPSIQMILKLNPMYYICQGYRDSFVFHRWFWENTWQMNAYFWTFTILVFLLGTFVFKKMRPQFADVL